MKSPEALKTQSLCEIHELREQKRHPQIRKDLEIIWIFSGAGTAKAPLEPHEPSWQRYRDSHRDRYAAVLAIMVTALRLNKSPREVTKEDVLEHGPVLFYNARASKSRDFREWLNGPNSKIPQEKVRIVETFVDCGMEKSIENTLDQSKTFPPELLGNDNKVRKIAIVSHAEHFPRIWRYLEQHFTQKDRVKFYTYPVKIPAPWTKEFAQIESEKVPEYYQKGDLAPDPISHDLD